MSLRLRLLLAVGAVALVALVVADIVTYRALSSFLYGRVDQSLDQEHVAIEQSVKNGPAEEAGFPGAPGAFVEVLHASGSVGAVEPARLPGGQSWSPRLPAHFTGFQTEPGPGEPYLYLTAPSTTPTGPLFRVRVERLSTGGTLIVAIPLLDTRQTLHRLLLIEIAVTAGALTAAGLLGWWLVRTGLRPLTDVERTANAITSGDLGRRVPGDQARTEVGTVARALNTMLGRIQDAFAERDATETELRQSEELLRRFVADASHELRTPLAAVSAYAELFERGASERPADLSRVISGIRTETGRMSRLVDDLLLLARLDEGLPLERRPLELVSLAGEAVETARTVGPSWPIALKAARPLEVLGDRSALKQVLDNLLANVRAHTPPGTTVRITIRDSGNVATVEVADNGPGFAEEEAARVFERFYRTDRSRSRQRGGTGLGLGIVAAIVDAHGGEVSASAMAGRGATFTIRLPLAPVVSDKSPEPAH